MLKTQALLFESVSSMRLWRTLKLLRLEVLRACACGGYTSFFLFESVSVCACVSNRLSSFKGVSSCACGEYTGFPVSKVLCVEYTTLAVPHLKQTLVVNTPAVLVSRMLKSCACGEYAILPVKKIKRALVMITRTHNCFISGGFQARAGGAQAFPFQVCWSSRR